MSTPILGIGSASFGGSIYGFGTPATETITPGRPMENQNQNMSLDARLIDTNTRDFVINLDGNTAGMTSVSQQVFLAMATTLGSSAVASVGNQIKEMQTLNPAYQSQIIGYTQSALSGLVSAGFISIVNITVTPLVYLTVVTGATVNLFWMDNSQNKMQQSNFNISG
jgi:hypothetical protein